MKLPSEFANEIARLMRDPDALRGRHGHYDPNQPRVPAGNPKGGQWTEKGGGGGARTVMSSEEIDKEIARLMRDPDALRHEREGMLGPHVPGRPEDGAWTDTSSTDATTGRAGAEQPQLVRFSPNRPPQVRPGPIGVLLSLFAILSARNTPEQRAIFEFNAREYLKDPSGELSKTNVTTLNQDQVRRACPGLTEVQNKTDDAATDVLANGGWSMSPQQFGTAVHKRLKDVINGDPDTNLLAEVSRVKSEEENVRYGRKDSVRIDVLECAPRKTVCVYDIKTGESRSSGLSPARMYELAVYALTACPATERVVVTEVRPSQ